MSGYLGNPDAESEHALVFAENGVATARALLQGRVLARCADCGDPIPEARRAYALKAEMKCEYCVPCQEAHDKAPRVKMLDWVL